MERRSALLVAVILAGGCSHDVAPPPVAEATPGPWSEPVEAIAQPEATPAAAELPIESEMTTWAGEYRAQLEPVGKAVAAMVNGRWSRDECNATLRAVYSARDHLSAAPDPDIRVKVRSSLGFIKDAAADCLVDGVERREVELRLDLGCGEIADADKVSLERYGLSLVVDGLGLECWQRAS